MTTRITLLLAGLLGAMTLLDVSAEERLAAGLQVLEYPRHKLQSKAEQFYLEKDKWGDPIGKPRVTKTLFPLEWDRERNAIAKGLLVVEQDGDYEFTANSFYDRNELEINGRKVCKYRDGDSRVVAIPLQKGVAEIAALGFVGSRGSAEFQWRPPGQREFSPIPAKLLKHRSTKSPRRKFREGIVADSLTVVAKDFVLEVYRNGKPVPDSQRKLLLDRFGATAERISIPVREGDWLVFHVAHNRLRHSGSKYFALAGALDEMPFQLVSELDSANWSACDDTEQVQEFIRHRDYGTTNPVLMIERPWEEGPKFMKTYAGEGFPGDAIWGKGAATWLKVVIPDDSEGEPAMIELSSKPEKGPQRTR